MRDLPEYALEIRRDALVAWASRLPVRNKSARLGHVLDYHGQPILFPAAAVGALNAHWCPWFSTKPISQVDRGALLPLVQQAPVVTWIRDVEEFLDRYSRTAMSRLSS